ncbi:MAG: Ferredoxin [Actinomycetia bacterium]|nr:Ferredoxin [Actinomycetes bacterium]
MTARISVDRAACKLHAECAAQAPDIFSFDVAGNLTYREEVGAAEAAEAEDAAFLCPTQSITVTLGQDLGTS